MAVSFRSARSATFSTATSVALTKPTGLADNDLMIAYVLYDRSSAGSATVTPPTGWTLLDSENPRGGQYLWVYYRQVTTASTEPASYTWTFSNTGNGCAVIDTRYGEDLSTPMGVHALAAGTASGGVSTITAPSVTTTGPQRLISTFLGTLTTATVATPAGLTSRASGSGIAASFRLADFTKLDAGATGDVTTSGSGGAPFGAQVSIKPANVAPNAPTLNSPANGATVDLTATQRLSWVFSDPDYGDTQSKFDLQYRIGTGSWTTITTTTANTYTDIAGGTFSAATYEWQVRTYDTAGLVGPWSASSFFTAANPPATPTITAPTSGSTVTTSTATVTWTAPAQDAYRVRRVADISGSPDTTSTPLWDSGIITATATRSVTVAFPTNSVDEHVEVQVRVGGLWSAWADALVHVAYTPPATPTLTLTADSGNPLDVFDPPRIIVAITDPTPTGGQPAVDHLDVYRSDDGQVTWTRVATGLASGATWTDYTPASGVDYSYRVVAVATDGTTSTSAAAGTATLIGSFGYGY